MSEQKYSRRMNVIRGPGEPQVYHSINQAKRASRKIQITEDATLGRGVLKNIRIK